MCLICVHTIYTHSFFLNRYWRHQRILELNLPFLKGSVVILRHADEVTDLTNPKPLTFYTLHNLRGWPGVYIPGSESWYDRPAETDSRQSFKRWLSFNRWLILPFKCCITTRQVCWKSICTQTASLRVSKSSGEASLLPQYAMIYSTTRVIVLQTHEVMQFFFW